MSEHICAAMTFSQAGIYVPLFLVSKESECFNDRQTLPISGQGDSDNVRSDDEKKELVIRNTPKEMARKLFFFF